MYAVLHLTGGSSEPANQSTSSFIQSLIGVEPNEHLEYKVVTADDLLKNEKPSSSESRELLLAKSIEKLISSKLASKSKSKKEEISANPFRVFILHNYPSTESEMLGLMDSKFKYPLLDGVVRMVHNSNGGVVIRSPLLS
jgi:hypothetical protein